MSDSSVATTTVYNQLRSIRHWIMHGKISLVNKIRFLMKAHSCKHYIVKTELYMS